MRRGCHIRTQHQILRRVRYLSSKITMVNFPSCTGGTKRNFDFRTPVSFDWCEIFRKFPDVAHLLGELIPNLSSVFHQLAPSLRYCDRVDLSCESIIIIIIISCYNETRMAPCHISRTDKDFRLKFCTHIDPTCAAKRTKFGLDRVTALRAVTSRKSRFSGVFWLNFTICHYRGR